MPRTTRRAVLAGLVAATAGCASRPSGAEPDTTARSTTVAPAGTTAEPTQSTTSSSGETASVGMSCDSDSAEYVFRPDLLDVELGTTVVFGVTSVCRQRTVAYHPDNDRPLRIPESAEPWASDVMQRSGTFEYTFAVEGVYDYFGLHESAGQVGRIVVGDPDPADQPALAPPQQSLPDAAQAALKDLNVRTRERLDQ